MYRAPTMTCIPVRVLFHRRDSRSQGRDRRGDGDYREEQYNDDV